MGVPKDEGYLEHSSSPEPEKNEAPPPVPTTRCPPPERARRPPRKARVVLEEGRRVWKNEGQEGPNGLGEGDLPLDPGREEGPHAPPSPEVIQAKYPDDENHPRRTYPLAPAKSKSARVHRLGLAQVASVSSSVDERAPGW